MTEPKTLNQRISDIITIHVMFAYNKKMRWCDALEAMETAIHKEVEGLVAELQKESPSTEEIQKMLESPIDKNPISLQYKLGFQSGWIRHKLKVLVMLGVKEKQT